MSSKITVSFSPPDINDEVIKEIESTLKSGWITTGPKTKLLEKKVSEYNSNNRTVCLNSATAALELTLRLLEIGPGDEVITTAYTYTASCSVICHVGATPVLVDVQENSFEMDYRKLEAAITEKTKAIIPVDIAGIICDYKKINEVIDRKKHLFNAENDIQRGFNKVITIADSAHAFGATKNNLNAGNFADFTCFSFHAVKNLTTAEGGAVTWRGQEHLNDEDIYKVFQILSLHGQTKDAFSKMEMGSWEYDIISPAYKCNMTDIHASIGLVQLKRYNEMLKRRHEIIVRYDKGLKGTGVQLLNHKDENHISSGHLYLVRVDGFEEKQRNELIVKMAECGVSCNVHYKPLPMLTAYKKLGFDIGDFPNAYNMYKNEISLPLHTLLTDNEVDYVIESLSQCIQQIRDEIMMNAL